MFGHNPKVSMIGLADEACNIYKLCHSVEPLVPCWINSVFQNASKISNEDALLSQIESFYLLFFCYL